MIWRCLCGIRIGEGECDDRGLAPLYSISPNTTNRIHLSTGATLQSPSPYILTIQPNHINIYASVNITIKYVSVNITINIALLISTLLYLINIVPIYITISFTNINIATIVITINTAIAIILSLISMIVLF